MEQRRAIALAHDLWGLYFLNRTMELAPTEGDPIPGVRRSRAEWVKACAILEAILLASPHIWGIAATRDAIRARIQACDSLLGPGKD